MFLNGRVNSARNVVQGENDMLKSKSFIITLLVFLIAINSLIFIVPSNMKYTNSFWLEYFLINGSIMYYFLGSATLFDKNSSDQMLFGYLITGSSSIIFIILVLIGIISMLSGLVPVWIGMYTCVAILLLTIIYISIANLGSRLVSKPN